MFLILALPRSRTFWLSKFLSYKDYECEHEEARHLRSVEDAKIWLNQEYKGSAETSVAPFWRLVRSINPDLKIVIVGRPVADVVKSLMALDMSGVCKFDESVLTEKMTRLNAKLKQIERRFPDAVSVKFDDLHNESTVKEVFEHCLPYGFDRAWWKSLKDVNLQCNMRSLVRYAKDYKEPLAGVVKTAAHLSRAQLMTHPPVSTDGVTFQQESFDDWIRDGVPLFREHLIQVGEPPDNWKKKNLPLMRRLYNLGVFHITTARCNGRMFGYLAATLSPSFESENLLSGLHTSLYASKDMPGLGLKLQRASAAALRQKGAGEILFYAGVRGDGPKTEVLYQRMGAKECGRFYRVRFEGV